MADNKQYIVKAEESGSVMISEDVIVAISAHAISEVDGVIGLNTKPGADIADRIGRKSWAKGMKIVIASDNTVSIDCNINIDYGQNVVSVAQAVQDAVKNAVEAMAGVKVVTVNVNVCGIDRK